MMKTNRLKLFLNALDEILDFNVVWCAFKQRVQSFPENRKYADDYCNADKNSRCRVEIWADTGVRKGGSDHNDQRGEGVLDQVEECTADVEIVFIVPSEKHD